MFLKNVFTAGALAGCLVGSQAQAQEMPESQSTIPDYDRFECVTEDIDGNFSAQMLSAERLIDDQGDLTLRGQYIEFIYGEIEEEFIYNTDTRELLGIMEADRLFAERGSINREWMQAQHYEYQIALDALEESEAKNKPAPGCVYLISATAPF